MYQGIVAEHGRCDHCGKTRWVATIPASGQGDQPELAYDGEPLKLCSGCIYKLVRLAGLLLKLEAAPKKKAPRKPKAARHRTAAEPPLGPFDHDEELEPEENRSRMP